MLNKKTITFLIYLFWVPSTHAVNVGSITTYIHSDKESVSKEISNPTNNARLILVSAEKLSSPEAGGEVVPMSRDELMLTPSRLLLSANAKNNIKFFYNGPKDDTERYYRINWIDMALSEDQAGNSVKRASAIATAMISTILVVSPRIEHFSYKLAEGKLINTGNVAYRVVAYGACLDKTLDEKQCKETYNDLPGKRRDFKFVDVNGKNSFVAIWHGEQFISVKVGD